VGVREQWCGDVPLAGVGEQRDDQLAVCLITSGDRQRGVDRCARGSAGEDAFLMREAAGR